MNLFRARFMREGPGIPRDLPPKHGFALLVDIVRREWWALIQLNLLCVLFSLPLVTIPAAQAAASRVCLTMLEDRNIYLWRDFREAFLDRFWRATALGLLGAAIVALSGYAASVFVQAARGNLLFVFPFVVGLCTALFALVATACALTLLAARNRPLGEVLRRALLLALARPLPVLAALVVVAALWLLHVAFYPVSIFMPAVLNFSFGTLAVTFGVHQAAAGLQAAPTGAPQAGAGAGGSAQLRVQ